VLECVVNISEGRDGAVVAAIAAAAGDDLLDVHRDPDHHRSVVTVVGVEAPRRVTRAALALLDLAHHGGAHPRIGTVDVVPFVALAGSTAADAIEARDRFAAWAGAELGVPCFLYGRLGDGTERTLPVVRAGAFVTLAPDTGPPRPDPRAGAIAVGARPPLVAYNVWLARPDLALARSIARSLRGPHLRALGLRVGEAVQVSMNLVDPAVLGPAQAYDLVAARAGPTGGNRAGAGPAGVERAELVGLVPAGVLASIDPTRWKALDLGPERTIEHRLAERLRRLGRGV